MSTEVPSNRIATPPTADDPLAKLFELDPQLGAAQPLTHVTDAISAPGQGLPEILQTLMHEYASRPALGFRRRESIYDPDSGRSEERLLPEFETITYSQLWSHTRAVAAAWQHHPDFPIRAGDFVATVGFASPDYVVADLACRLIGAVAVPLQHNASNAQLRQMLIDANPKVLVSTAESLPAVLDAATEAKDLRWIVVIDYRPANDDHRDALIAAHHKLRELDRAVELHTLENLIIVGCTMPEPELYLPEDDTRLAMIMYTSGSTGAPKGAMITEAMLTKLWVASAPAGIRVPMIGVAFMPLNHMAARVGLASTLAAGGTCYFTPESNLSTLMQDLALVRPTMVGLVPRVVDMLFQQYQSRVDALFAQGGDADTAEKTAIAELRQNVLGGRVLGALVVTAPLSSEMKSFMESSLGIPVADLYGLTEIGGIVRNGVVLRPPVVDYKLVDVPELGYHSTDKPYPRGELLVKSLTATPGYYKRPDITAEVFDADGYYRTGDVMAEVAADHLVYVDRRNNVIKLAQGEFVAISNLEIVYAGAPLVRQIFIYGNSERSYLLAIVVPTDDALRAYPDVAGLKNAVHEALRQTANTAQLQPYEIPADLLIETEPFTAENGLLSAVGKQLRPKLKERYAPRLEELYAQLATARSQALEQLRELVDERPLADTVVNAVQILLDIPPGAARSNDHFTDLGGDSLSALTLSNLLRDLFGTDVPVGVITGPATNLGALADYIENERNTGSRLSTFETVHGPDPTFIRAADLKLEKFIDAEALSTAESLESTSEIQTVLLTGANGYLGRFLCLQWLQRLSQTGGKLICLVRGENSDDALARLEDAFSSGESGLLREFRHLAQGHLEVIPADISRFQFGVGSPTWDRLAHDVDLIVHQAALVNHVLPYSQLFQPNVVGTAEIIRLAITARIKPVSYLSTVAVTLGVPNFEEDGDIRALCPVRGIDDDGYANGYANSKWAGEVLLREAHDLCGMPATVFRADMILAHRSHPGQLNAADAFTRLVLSLVTTGLAPRSFYQNEGKEGRPRAHYDGLPADFVAEAVTTLASTAYQGFRSYNVMNPHDDGISADTFVDWLIDAGQRIDIIDDYRQWLSRFETALRHLPEPQRRNSLLPLLNAYQQPQVPHRGSSAPTGVFRKAVQDNRIGDENDIPHLEPSLILKYLSDLRTRGLL